MTHDADRDMSWNAGSWFGSTLGGASWMLVGGMLLLRKEIWVAAVVLGLYAAIGLIALTLWRRRQTLPYFLSLAFVVVLIGLASFISVFVIDRAGHWEAIQMGSKISPMVMYVVLGFGIPLMLGILWLQRWLHSLPHTEQEEQ